MSPSSGPAAVFHCLGACTSFRVSVDPEDAACGLEALGASGQATRCGQASLCQPDDLRSSYPSTDPILMAMIYNSHKPIRQCRGDPHHGRSCPPRFGGGQRESRGSLSLDEFPRRRCPTCVRQQEPRVPLLGPRPCSPRQGPPTQWATTACAICAPGRVRLEGDERLLPPNGCSPGGDQPERVRPGPA